MPPPPARAGQQPAQTTAQPPSAGAAGDQSTALKPAQKRKRESLIPTSGQKSWITAATNAQSQWPIPPANKGNDKKAAGNAGKQAAKATGRKHDTPKAGKQQTPVDSEAEGDGEEQASGVIDQGDKKKKGRAKKQQPSVDTEAEGDGEESSSRVIDQGDKKKKPRARKQPNKKQQDDDQAAESADGADRSDKKKKSRAKKQPARKEPDDDEAADSADGADRSDKKKGRAKKQPVSKEQDDDEAADSDDGLDHCAKKNTKSKRSDTGNKADTRNNTEANNTVETEEDTDINLPEDSPRQPSMSSSFDRQQVSFLSSMSAAAAKLGSGAGTKRSLAPPSPSPSVGSTTSAAAGSLTPRRTDRDAPAANIVYSQPALTGTGDSIISQMAYAVSWLRGKDEPVLCVDVLSYLSITARPEQDQEFFVDQMRRNPQIQWIPDPTLSEQTWQTGTYLHRPIIPGVKSKTSLLAYLQKKTDASGVSVKDLKDGWQDCESAINELEKEHRVLVIRAKKDGAARIVWLDDASLFHDIDPELKIMWSRVEVPSTENIVARLVAAGQKPSSEDPRVKAALAPKDNKKKKAQRRSGKSTNLHMEHLLKDYSHMKR